MGKQVDERIVEMRFDNKQFEAGAKTTMTTLDNLKKKLDFQNAGKSVDEVQNKINNIKFSQFENSLKTIENRLSILHLAAARVAGNIATEFTNAGRKIIKDFTIDPIKTGFQEYETQMGAIQTILSNTSHAGTSLDDVNAALNELNHYADKTIYNFTQMTKNIGTFTAAGVNLEDSTNSIKGIANLAAVSGSTAQQASTAMYQLSQALAAGRVSLMDWNSVVNAGMGGKVFQDALIRTSELLKTGAKGAIKFYGSFRESLTQGEWLTTEVLTETLKQLAGVYDEADLIAQGYSEKQAKDIVALAKNAESAATDVKTFTQMIDTLKETAQSGWTQTWEMVIGDFEASKQLWTDVNNALSKVLNNMSDARNALFEDVLLSGWERLANEGVKNIDLYKDAIGNIAKEHGIALEPLIASKGSFDMALRTLLDRGELTYRDLEHAVHDYTLSLQQMSAEELKAAGYNDSELKKLEEFNSKVGDVRNVWEKLADKGISDTTRFQKIIGTFATKSGSNMDYLVAKYGNLSLAITEGLKSGEISHEVIGKSVSEYAKQISNLNKKQKEASGISKEQIEMAKNLDKQIKNGTISIEDYIDKLGKIDGEISMKSFFNRLGELDGRDLFIQSIKNLANAVKSIINPIKEAFVDIFPEVSADKVYESLKKFEEFTYNLKLSGDSANKVKRTFKGLLSIFNMMVKPVKALVKLFAPAVDTSGNFLDIILSLTACIGDFFTAIDEADNATKGLETTVSKFASKIGDGINYIIDNLKELIKYFDLDKEFFTPEMFEFDIGNIAEDSKILNTFASVMSKVKESMGFDVPPDNLTTVAEGINLPTVIQYASTLSDIKDTLEEKPNISLFDTTTKFLDKVKNKFKDATGWAKSFSLNLSSLNFGGILAGGTVIAGIIGAFKFVKKLDIVIKPLISIANNLGNIGGSISKAIVSLAGCMKQVSNTLEAYQKNLKATVILKVAAAIAILSLSLVLLSKVPADKLIVSAIALGVVATAVIGLLKAFKELEKVKSTRPDKSIQSIAETLKKSVHQGAKALKWAAIGFMIRSMTITIIAIIGAIVLVGKLYEKDKSAIQNGAIIVGSIAAALFGMVAGIYAIISICNKFAGKSGSTLNMFTLIGVASVLRASVLAIVTLMSIKMPHDWFKRMVIFKMMFESIISLVVLMNLSSAVNKNGVKAGGTMLGISALLITIVGSMYALSLLPMGQIKKGLKVLAVVFGMLAAVLVSMSAIANPKVGFVVFGIAAIIIALTGALSLLSLIPAESLLKSTLALKMVLNSIALVFLSMGAIRVNGTEKTAAMIAITLGALVAGLTILSFVPFNRMLTGVIGMYGVVGMLILLIRYISKSSGLKDINKVKLLATVAGVLVVVAASLAVLANQPWQGILAAAVAMSAVLGAVVLSLKPITSINKKSLDKGKLILLGAVVLALIPIAAALTVVATQPWENILAAATGISLVLTTVIGTMAILDSMANMKNILPAIALLAFGCGGLAIIAYTLTQVANSADPEALMATANSLSQVLLTIGVVMGIATLTGMAAPAAIIGGGLLIAFIAAIIGGLYLLGSKIAEYTPTITQGIELLKQIGRGLGETIGSFIDGVMLEGTQSLPTIGNNFSEFWSKASGFFEGINSLGDGIASKIKAISSALLSITAAELVQGLMNFEGAPLAEFGAELSDFMDKASSFFEKIDKVPETAIDKVKSISKILLMLTGNEIVNGISKMLGFGGSLSDFATQLNDLAPALVDFAEQTKDITKDSVKGAAAATEMMANAAKNLYGTGGIQQLTFGEKNLAEFAKQLADMGPYLRRFVNKVANMNPDVVSGAAKIIKTVISLANEMPNEGGFAALLMGDNTMESFGKNLESLGKSLVAFASKMSELKIGQANSTNVAIDILQKFSNMPLPPDGLLSSFGNELVKFGGHLELFNGSVLYMNIEKWNGMIGTLDKFKDLAISLQGVDVSVLTTFSDAMTTLSGSFMKSDTSMEDMGQSVLAFLTNINVAFQNNSETIKQLGTSVSDMFFNGWTSNIPGTIFAVSEFVKLITSTMMTFGSTPFTDNGRLLAERFVMGIRGKKPAATKIGKELANSVIGGIKSVINSNAFQRLGANAAQGFINGLNSKLDEVRAAANELGEVTKNAVRHSLDEHSPSKEMAKIANFAGLGYILKLRSFVAIAYDESKKIGLSTIEGVKKGYSRLSAVVNLDSITDPVIKPTVDLSNVRESAKSVSRMFNEAIHDNANFASNVSAGIVATKSAKEELNKETDKSAKGTTNVTYTQINNSPKALSRIDIYRHTKNQLSTVEEVIKNV